MDYSTWIILSLLLVAVDNACSETEDLINTKEITSDLKWTPYPMLHGWEEVSGLDANFRSIRYYQVCNRDNPDVDNWVRTPYIKSRGAKRAYIDVEFSMLKCDSVGTKNCRETFNLYYYENDNDVASSTFPPWRERPYIKIDTIAAGKRFSHGDQRGNGINKKTWTLGPLSKRGFYIAAHDKGACMSLLSLRVYYFYCPETTIAFANFKRTVAGKDVASLVTVSGKCVNNSKAASAEGPRYHCNSNGEWRVRTGTCQCTPGYQASEDMRQCEPCSTGKYKVGTGNHGCLDCPRNSISTTSRTTALTNAVMTVSKLEKPTGAPAFCKCLPGFYRSPGEDVHAPCTRPPSEPTELKYVVNETSTVMSWSEPADLGERVDVFYSVDCQKCSGADYAECTECGNKVTFVPAQRRRITDSRVQVNDLDAYTHYQFKIYALNGVSSVSADPDKYAVVQVMTNQAAPSRVVEVRKVDDGSHTVTIAWSLPKRANGRVLGYEVRVQEVSSGTTDKGDLSAYVQEPQIPASYKTDNRSLALVDLRPGRKYAVKVRAYTAAGYGDYSDKYMVRTDDAEEPILLSDQAGSNRLNILIGIGASVVMFLGIIAGSFFLYSSRRKRTTTVRFSDSTEMKDSFEDARQLVAATSAHRLYVEYPDPHKAVREFAAEIDPKLLEIEDTIGQGEFGEVYRGKLRKSSSQGTETHEVAIKRLKHGANVKDQLNFLREACTMAQFDHPNVLILKGVVTKTRPLMIISEYMENGSLNSFLKRHQGELSILQLANMLHGIASGMQYLSEMQYVHRDLAARNILINSDLVCKVSDFGLSRTLENDPRATYTTQGGKIAIRWTAPECIRFREFTSASDIWSYGILMWEVMSYGEKPYWDMTNQDVLDSIEEGYRLPAPFECPNVLHKIMIECWTMEPKQRPTFEQLVQRLEEIIRTPEVFKDSSTATSPTSETKSCEGESDN